MNVSNDSMMSSVQDGNSSSLGQRSPHPAQEVVMWVVPALNITLNLLVFVVVPRIKTLRVSTILGMISLAVTDVSYGTTCLINSIYNTHTGFRQQSYHPICAFVGFAGSIFASCSLLMLAYLNIDRLLTFLYPLKYQLSRRLAIIINLVIWVAAVVAQIPNILDPTGFGYYEHAFLCLPIMYSGTYKTFLFIFISGVAIIINVVSFCGSFYLIRSRHKRVFGRASSVRVNYGRQVSSNSDSRWRHDTRIFKVLAIMTIGFYITWTPYMATMAFPEIIIGRTLHPVTDFLSIQLVASNSFWNPIIYMLTLRPFRSALSQLCGNTLCGRYMCPGTRGSVERPAAPPGVREGTTDKIVNTTQEQGAQVKHCTRF